MAKLTLDRGQANEREIEVDEGSLKLLLQNEWALSQLVGVFNNPMGRFDQHETEVLKGFAQGVRSQYGGGRTVYTTDGSNGYSIGAKAIREVNGVSGYTPPSQIDYGSMIQTVQSNFEGLRKEVRAEIEAINDNIQRKNPAWGAF